MIKVNSYDIDGCIYMGEHHDGLRPGPEDIIVTGRSYEEKESTLAMLRSRNIHNMVFFNPLSRYDEHYGRGSSGYHKARVFNQLKGLGIQVVLHFEDDDIQKKAIEKSVGDVKVIMIGDGTPEYG